MRSSASNRPKSPRAQREKMTHKPARNQITNTKMMLLLEKSNRCCEPEQRANCILRKSGGSGWQAASRSRCGVLCNRNPKDPSKMRQPTAEAVPIGHENVVGSELLWRTVPAQNITPKPARFHFCPASIFRNPPRKQFDSRAWTARVRVYVLRKLDVLGRWR